MSVAAGLFVLSMLIVVVGGGLLIFGSWRPSLRVHRHKPEAGTTGTMWCGCANQYTAPYAPPTHTSKIVEPIPGLTVERQFCHVRHRIRDLPYVRLVPGVDPCGPWIELLTPTHGTFQRSATEPDPAVVAPRFVAEP
jgi:hypothetical protein